MRKSKNIVVSLILVLLIVVFVSKALQESYLKITSGQAIPWKVNNISIHSKSIEKSEKKDDKLKIDKKVSTGEIKRKVIVIDPGHANKSNLDKEPIEPNSRSMKIKDGGGAEGVLSKTPEYLVNMKVALKLRTILEERGYIVKMTKVENSKSLGNVERVEIANKENADLAIRIHADSSDNSSVNGASMLIPAPINENTKLIYDKSSKYGKIILDRLVKDVGMQNRGLSERKDMTGFNWSKVPVVLVEMGFLSNAEEDKLLSSTEYQNKLAKALAEGIGSALQ